MLSDRRLRVGFSWEVTNVHRRWTRGSNDGWQGHRDVSEGFAAETEVAGAYAHFSFQYGIFLAHARFIFHADLVDVSQPVGRALYFAKPVFPIRDDPPVPRTTLKHIRRSTRISGAIFVVGHNGSLAPSGWS